VEPKQVIKPGAARAQAQTPQNPEAVTPVETPAATPEAPKKEQWKFIKLRGPSQKLRFKDGSEYQFRLIQKNDGSGYCETSWVITDDRKLAENLRTLPTGFGVVEVKI
jgi:hypothetical protein